MPIAATVPTDDKDKLTPEQLDLISNIETLLIIAKNSNHNIAGNILTSTIPYIMNLYGHNDYDSYYIY